MSSTKCLLVYKNVSVSILMSSVLSTCGLDYSNSLWMPGLHTLHVYFLYHLTWCRPASLENLVEQYAHWCECFMVVSSVSFYNFYNLQDKIIQTSSFCQIWQKLLLLTEKLYLLICSKISIKHSTCRIVFNNLSRCLNYNNKLKQ